MKLFILLVSSCFLFLNAQQDTLLSGVYKFPEAGFVNSTEEIIRGNTADIENFRVSVSLIRQGESYRNSGNEETLIIIKEGEVEVSLKDLKNKLNPGSIAYIMSGENYYLKNSGEKNAVFYQLIYKSKTGGSHDKGTSFLVKWDELVFKPHDRGGIREYFEKPTSMFKRFEMHVTTLKAGIKSHEPHTHRAEEIVLMIEGNSEMLIGEELKAGSAGDLYFLGANVPHALRNTGEKPCTYFAFQWE